MLSVLSQDQLQASRIANGLRQLFVVPRARLKICSAYITPGGLGLLQHIAEQEIGTEAWKRLPKEAITCVDFGITTPDALKQLLALEICECWVVNAHVMDRPNFKPDVAFHPKAYCVHSRERGRVLCGSANLTRRGLTINTEMAVLSDDSTTVSEFTRAFDAIGGRTRIDKEFVETYASRRKPKSEEPEDKPIPVVSVPGDLPAFSEFVSRTGRGTLPSRFWIEAGSMSSSGSRHQLELPRRGNRYFGFRHNQYDGEQHEIGTVSLVKGRRRWDDRRIVWHGDNGMERLYLPTRNQGGVSYVNKGLLFESLYADPNAFALTVVPWESEIARSWVNASVAANLIFRVPQNPRPNARICGLMN